MKYTDILEQGDTLDNNDICKILGVYMCNEIGIIEGAGRDWTVIRITGEIGVVLLGTNLTKLTELLNK